MYGFGMVCTFEELMALIALIKGGLAEMREEDDLEDEWDDDLENEGDDEDEWEDDGEDSYWCKYTHDYEDCDTECGLCPIYRKWAKYNE